MTRLLRWWREPVTLLESLGFPLMPYVCHACGEPLTCGMRAIHSERYGGPVDPDCAAIPMWIRHQGDMLRLVWLRTTEEDRVRQPVPAPFSLEAALRTLRAPAAEAVPERGRGL